MSEREGRRRKYHSSKDHGNSHQPKKTLFRHDQNKESERKRNEPKELLKSNKPQQPTILLKTREKETPKEQTSTSKSTGKEGETSAAAGIQIQKPKPVYIDVTSNLWNPPIMTQSVPLIDRNFVFSDAVAESLMESSTDFLVVGVIGEKGVGKSTIMNLLAQHTLQQQLDFLGLTKDEFSDEFKLLTLDDVDLKRGKEYFKVETLKHVELGNPCTEGVDVFITCNRIILLDCEPMLSLSHISDMIENEVKPSIGGENMSVENANEIQSLQLATFLLTACHVVILVDDWFCNTNMIRFLHSAEMLKPSQSITEEELMEHSPHLLLLRNKAKPEEFSPSNYNVMQNFYHALFNQSKYQIESGLNMAKDNISRCLSATVQNDVPVNVFSLPDFYEYSENSAYRAQPSLEILLQNLKSQILGAIRNPITQTQLNERTWFHFAGKAWDAIKKNSFFIEYNKLIP